VDDRAGKAKRIKELMEGVICATNALGLGVDLLDIRVVIYAGQPQKLLEF
jgi:superfamily II DNA helicase RecQ